MIPQISIVVPVYNVEKYLCKCVDSILSQTFTNYELILIDDGSTDQSGVMCDEYAKRDSRILVIHQHNQGLSVARNNGINVAKGEFMGFVDSDDWVEPDMFQNLMTTALDKNADIVICRFRNVDVEGKSDSIVGYDTEKVMSKYEATKEVLHDILLNSFAWNKLYKRYLFSEIEYPSGRYFEDTATTYKLIYRSETVVAIPYIGYNYRKNPTSILNNYNWSYTKQVKRELDNAFAFGERYIFCKTDEKLIEALPVCAKYAYQRIRSFIHLWGHKRFKLSKEQIDHIDYILSSFRYKDLSGFSLFEKVDLILFHISKPLLRTYLKVIAFIHPMQRDF